MPLDISKDLQNPFPYSMSGASTTKEFMFICLTSIILIESGCADSNLQATLTSGKSRCYILASDEGCPHCARALHCHPSPSKSDMNWMWYLLNMSTRETRKRSGTSYLNCGPQSAASSSLEKMSKLVRRLQ
jgi:hypothetical protein